MQDFRISDISFSYDLSWNDPIFIRYTIKTDKDEEESFEYITEEGTLFTGSDSALHHFFPWSSLFDVSEKPNFMPSEDYLSEEKQEIINILEEYIASEKGQEQYMNIFPLAYDIQTEKDD